MLIVGGGPAAMEAALALRDVAGEQVAMTILAPDPEFVFRPFTVAEPFNLGVARRYDLRAFATELGAEFVEDALASIDATARTVTTVSGGALDYDSAIIAVGARPVEPFPHTLTFAIGAETEPFHELVVDLEGGSVRRIVFLVPDGPCWPLPVYELALLTADRAWDMNLDDVEVIVATPEPEPLRAFGPAAGAAVRRLLDDVGVELVTGARAEVPARHTVVLAPSGRRIEDARIVSAPLLTGPRVAGLPADADGFLPIDDRCQVRGVEGVFAAGDGTDFPVKQGGIATLQADAAAQAVAAAAGAATWPAPFRPQMRGTLLVRKGRARAAREPGPTRVGPLSWWPPTKIVGRHLTPYLVGVDLDRALRVPTGTDRVAIELSMPD